MVQWTEPTSFWLGGRKTQDSVESPWRPWSIPLYQRVGPQQRSIQQCPVSVPFCPIPLFSLTLYVYTHTFWYLYLPVHTSQGIFFKLPFLDIFRVPRALTSLTSYWSPEVHSLVSRLTTNTTKPIGSACYISRLSSQGLNFISSILFYITDRVMFFKNGGTLTLLITRGIPSLHQAIIVVETSQHL